MENLKNTIGIASFIPGGMKITWLPNVKCTNTVAKIILKKAMADEGLSFNDKNRVIYLRGWADSMTEISSEGIIYDADTVGDYVADSLLYSSENFIIDKRSKKQVSNDLVDIIFMDMIKIFKQSLAEVAK